MDDNIDDIFEFLDIKEWQYNDNREDEETLSRGARSIKMRVAWNDHGREEEEEEERITELRNRAQNHPKYHPQDIVTVEGFHYTNHEVARIFGDFKSLDWK